MADTLYVRLGGYDGIAAVADDLLPCRQQDVRLARFWADRGTDGLRWEKQLLIDHPCSCVGGPLLYTGRDMKTAHVGMCIGEGDRQGFTDYIAATLEAVKVPAGERAALFGFVERLKGDIVG
jgi:hemoglobin